MTTMWLLLGMHEGRPMLPVAEVAQTYFGCTADKFLSKVRAGDIDLPLVQLDEKSQKSPKFIMITDLAQHIERRHDAAKRLADQMRV